MNTVNLLCVILVSFTSVCGFSWNSCGTSSDPLKVITLDVVENNARQLLVTGRGKAGMNLTAPIKGTIEMRKKLVWGWTKIPCVDNFGSCKYDDICTLSPYEDPCPKIFTDNALPCHCPFPQGAYAAKNFPISLKIVPKWLEKGRYKLKGQLSSGNKQLICLEVDITI